MPSVLHWFHDVKISFFTLNNILMVKLQMIIGWNCKCGPGEYKRN